MEKRVKLKTAVEVERREARTVEAMSAALVERDEGKGGEFMDVCMG